MVLARSFHDLVKHANKALTAWDTFLYEMRTGHHRSRDQVL